MNPLVNTSEITSFDRRSFLKAFSGVTAFVGVTAMGGAGEASAAAIGPESRRLRSLSAYQIRIDRARALKNRALVLHPSNQDDTLYPNFIGSFTKALPHNAMGEVDVNAYKAYRKALDSGKQKDLNAIQLGGVVKLANPQGAYAYSLEGADSHNLTMPAAPALNSARTAGEMTELYWRAWTRDVPFIDYSSDPKIAAAATDLNRLSDFAAPKTGGVVNAENIFRSSLAGDLTGPLISQFLWRNVPAGPMTIVQRYRTTAENDNHVTSYANWLTVQNGGAAPVAATPDPTTRYIANGRDLAEYVHFDFSYQAFLNAALILQSFGTAALDDGNPYKSSITNQGGFVTFGGPMILDLVARVAVEALKAAWYQKWLVHRRLRPEAYGGLVHHKITGAANYPIHPDVLNSSVLPLIQGVYGTSLLPMAYPEGSPTHPAYPGGHATISGACTTILKAYYNEDFAVPAPVQANSNGTSLLPYSGSLTVGGELNKLASNVSLGRETGGVHWRSDDEEGLLLGEQVAIQLLRDHYVLDNERFSGFRLTKFDGSQIQIQPKPRRRRER